MAYEVERLVDVYRIHDSNDNVIARTYDKGNADKIADALNNADSLRAEVERLRTALGQIVEYGSGYVVHVAREALKHE